MVVPVDGCGLSVECGSPRNPLRPHSTAAEELRPSRFGFQVPGNLGPGAHLQPYHRREKADGAVASPFLGEQHDDHQRDGFIP